MKRVSVLAIFFVLCLVLPVLSSSVDVRFVTSQAVGWSDDFDDANIDGWSVQGWNATDVPATSLPGNFTADDLTLRAQDDEWNQAYRPSNVIYGSWIFDVECVDTPANHFYVAFVSGSITAIDTPSAEYGLMFVTGVFGSWDNDVVFYQRNQGQFTIVPVRTYDLADLSGWHHINITRDLDANFTISFNGTIRMEVNLGTFSSSDAFSFYTEAGPAIDNIEVTPFSETTSPTSSPTSPPPNGEPVDLTILLIIGGGLAVIVVIAIVIRFKK